MFGINLPKKEAGKIQHAIEYVAPHWVVLLRNPGQKHWTALRSTTKMIRVPNEFNDIVESRPAIETFPSMKAASDWVTEHLPGSAVVTRKDGEIEKFLMKAKSPIAHVPHAA